MYSWYDQEYINPAPGLCTLGRVRRILSAEKLAEFGTFSGKFHVSPTLLPLAGVSTES